MGVQEGPAGGPRAEASASSDLWRRCCGRADVVAWPGHGRTEWAQPRMLKPRHQRRAAAALNDPAAGAAAGATLTTAGPQVSPPALLAGLEGQRASQGRNQVKQTDPGQAARRQPDLWRGTGHCAGIGRVLAVPLLICAAIQAGQYRCGRRGIAVERRQVRRAQWSSGKWQRQAVPHHQQA